MRLSRNTIAVLRNFAKINDGVAFQKGNKLRTVERSKRLLAEAILDDEFPQDGAIYSLKELLSKIRPLTNPLELTFEDFATRLHVTVELSGKDTLARASAELPKNISSLPLRDIADALINLNANVIGSKIVQVDHCGGTRSTGTITLQEDGTKGRTVTVYMCDSRYIISPPDKRLTQIINPLTFDLYAADLAWLKRTAKKHKTALKLFFDGNTIRFRKFVSKEKPRSSQEWVTQGDLTVGTGDGTPFAFCLDMDCFEYLMPGSYSVEVRRPLHKKDQSFAHFVFKGFPLEYWISLEWECPDRHS